MTSASTLKWAPDIEIELFTGPRRALRSLFQLAEDSDAVLDQYMELGEVLVARTNAAVVGHIQVIAAPTSWIASVAVVNSKRGRGIGTALIRAGLARLFSAGADRVLVATASADIDNLRLYQQLGFRFLKVERDAFTAERGYSPGLRENGIPVRDRVWLSIDAPAE